MRELLRASLEPTFSVEAVASSEEGLDVLSLHAPALILLDLKMPGMGGLEFIRQAKARCVGGTPPIVVMTASVYDCPEALENGAVGYILKPFNALDLKMQIAVHMDKGGESRPLLKEEP